MILDTLWREIEHQHGQADVPGLTVRRIDPSCPDDLFIGLRYPIGTRIMLLRLSSAGEVPKSALVQSRGFSTRVSRFEHGTEGAYELAIEALDPSFNIVFGVVAEDLFARISSRSQTIPASSVFLSGLEHWKRFFDAARTEGLSRERQLGLFGELWFINEFAIPHIGNSAIAIDGWVGPDPLSKDFEYSECAIEVKTCASREPAKVFIHGERQLDDTGFERVYLFAVVVELSAVGGMSLPELVEALRIKLGDIAGRVRFEEKLLQYGYQDINRGMYEQPRMIVHDCRSYRVDSGFPRITSEIPSGVGDLAYSLTLSACSQFLLPLPQLATALSLVHRNDD